jgi:CRISPR-associated protein Csm3
MSLKLEKYMGIKGTLRCRTGLHIGGSKDDIEIGGLDSPVLRDPLTSLPYIPGSSLKGKLRSALEYRYCADEIRNGEPCGCGKDTCPVCRLFGPHKKPMHDLGPTRIIVRDALLKDTSKKELGEKLERGALYTEIKQEVSIDRKTGTASRAGPRPVERVPAGTEFDLNISLRVFEGDEESKMVGYIKEALNLLQQDYLGGSGTRGYGWVEVQNLNVIDNQQAG